MQFKRFAKPLSQIFGAAARNTPIPADKGAAATAGPSAANLAAALDSASAEQLTATALGDDQPAVRAAAIGKLEDVETLRRLAGLTTDATPDVPGNLRRLAQERLAQLVDAGGLGFSRLCEPGQVARLVLEGASSRLRQLAAQSISDPLALKALLRQLRGKDKSVYKIIKQKCDALRGGAAARANPARCHRCLRIARAARS